MNFIHERLVEIRQTLGFSIEEMVRRIAYSTGYYQAVEKGRYPVSSKLVTLLTQQFSVNPDYLRQGSGELFLNQVMDTRSDKETVADRIRRLRMERKLSLQAFAALCSCTAEGIRQMESGEHKVSERIAGLIAQANQVSLDWLLTGNELSREYPLDERMVEYLNQHPEKRRLIQEWMEEASVEE